MIDNDILVQAMAQHATIAKQYSEDIAATHAVMDLFGMGYSTRTYTWDEYKAIKDRKTGKGK